MRGEIWSEREREREIKMGGERKKMIQREATGDN